MKQVTEETKRYLISLGYPEKEEIYYIEVWLWLAKENIAWIDVAYYYDGTWEATYSTCYGDVASFCDCATQEDAIAEAIEDIIKVITI